MTPGDAQTPKGTRVVRPAVRSILANSLWSLVMLATIALAASLAGGATGPSVGPWSVRRFLGWVVAACAAVGAAKVVHEVLARVCRRYTLDERHITATSGILHRTRVEVPLHRVQEVILDRTLAERLLGIGSIMVMTAGSRTPAAAWMGVARPAARLEEVRAAIAPGAPSREAGGARRPARSGQRRPFVVGLVGGIGAGKSAVAAELSRHGFLVVDSDAEAKAALDRPEVRARLVEWWGSGVLDESGRVDRARVASIVFEDPAQRERLEGLVHPLVAAGRAEAIARRGPGARGVVIDAPLLYEAGVDRECDVVVFVDAPRAARLERVRATRGWSEEEFDRREKAQLSLDEKKRRADVVIANDAGAEELSRAVARLVEGWNEAGRTGPEAGGAA